MVWQRVGADLSASQFVEGSFQACFQLAVFSIGDDIPVQVDQIAETVPLLSFELLDLSNGSSVYKVKNAVNDCELRGSHDVVLRECDTIYYEPLPQPSTPWVQLYLSEASSMHVSVSNSWLNYTQVSQTKVIEGGIA